MLTLTPGEQPRFRAKGSKIEGDSSLPRSIHSFLKLSGPSRVIQNMRASSVRCIVKGGAAQGWPKMGQVPSTAGIDYGIGDPA